MTTFTEAKVTLDEIARLTDANRKANDALLAKAAANEASLLAMQSKYAGIVSAIDAEVVANPGDVAWIAAQAEKDKLQAEFIAEKARAATIVSVLTGL